MKSLAINNIQKVAGQYIHYDHMPRWRYNKKTGAFQVPTSRGMWVNSVLRKDEWEELDRTVVMEATKRLNGVAHLAQRGLTFSLGGIGTISAEYNTVSEMTRASVNIRPQSRSERDQADFSLAAVPVPVIEKPYDIDARTLDASRRLGNSLDTVNGRLAGRVVAEELERMLFLGNANIVHAGNTIYGYTTQPNRKTGSGSDWGTAGNAITTVSAMINALQGSDNNHFGPYMLYASTNQYNELYNVFFTDGSGDNQADRVMRMTGVEGIAPSDWLTDGECVLVQMDYDTVDLAFVPGFGFNYVDETRQKVEITGVTNLEWTSGDGMLNYFKALSISVPRVKATYGSKSGIAHYDSI